MAKSVVVQNEKKTDRIFELLGCDCQLDEFSKKFMEEYPKDWDNIKKTYKNHEKSDKKGKGHPMPEPNKYVENMYKVGKKRNENNSECT